jgi:hypothetical protein
MDATERFKRYCGALAAQVCSLEAEVETLQAEVARLRALLPDEAPSQEGGTVPE